ncbi:hypothetical protein VTO42DRAFT_8851 [Malbranchea cinnamomea]
MIMAPDLNSVPPSPRPQETLSTIVASGSVTVSDLQHASRSPSLSRRVSQNLNMGPSPAAFGPSSSTAHSTGDNTGVGSGPGPLRHPRPLTIADLHLELEKEQEAVVNRLTRELSLLRQQTASVASTTSSASINYNDLTDLHMISGSTQPVPARHRSSSTISSRSVSISHGGNVAAGTLSSREGVAPSLSRTSLDRRRGSFGRETPDAASPSLSLSLHQQHQGGNLSRSHSRSHSRSRSLRSSMAFFPVSNSTTQAQSSNLSEYTRSVPTTSPQAMARYEEIAWHRAELEAAKRENEMLRRRVRELEATLQQHRRSQERSASEITASSLASELSDIKIDESQSNRELEAVN